MAWLACAAARQANIAYRKRRLSCAPRAAVVKVRSITGIAFIGFIDDLPLIRYRENMEFAQVKAACDAGDSIVLDVRSVEEIQKAGKIPGSVNIPITPGQDPGMDNQILQVFRLVPSCMHFLKCFSLLSG